MPREQQKYAVWCVFYPWVCEHICLPNILMDLEVALLAPWVNVVFNLALHMSWTSAYLSETEIAPLKMVMRLQCV